ncbi:MAG TPA: nuclear transport factor 2 family protein [Gemmatimonadales bacterium]|nr:nuclear transport factor 2 family protein [Gemmatimonadales bacterium]
MRVLLAGLALAALCPRAAAQSPQAEVLAVVQRLFDAMRAGDSAMARSVFEPNARLVATGIREGQPYVRVTPADEFVAAVGRPRDVVWDERIWDAQVRIDGNLASVWTQYAFYVGERFSHCGVDAFHLVRRAEGWKIMDLADTRRQEACDVPPSR